MFAEGSWCGETDCAAPSIVSGVVDSVLSIRGAGTTFSELLVTWTSDEVDRGICLRKQDMRKASTSSGGIELDGCQGIITQV
jgi:hypothetical protein